MKHIAAIALALTISGGAATAGNVHVPIMEKPIVVEDAKAGSSSSGTTIVLALAALLFAAAMN